MSDWPDWSDTNASQRPSGDQRGDPSRFSPEVKERGFTIGSGYGKNRETTVRIGHMGDHTLEGLERAGYGVLVDPEPPHPASDIVRTTAHFRIAPFNTPLFFR